MTLRAWNDLDLEQFHDNALPAPLHEALAADLRTDPALRERLARVARLDAAARSALLDEPEPDRAARPAASGHSLARFALLALAAALALALVGVWAAQIWNPRSPADTERLGADADIDPLHPADTDRYQPVRILFSWPLPADHDGERPAREPAARPAPQIDGAPEPPGPGLEQRLRSGDVQGALSILSRTDDAGRRRGYEQIGRALRSAMTARDVLDGLSEAEQIEACRLWAADPSLRPVVFQRLAELRSREHLADAVRAAAADLQTIDELRPWLRSYGLAG